MRARRDEDIAREIRSHLGAFGLLAMTLAVTGIYGLASYSVSQRVREIGVRRAISADPLRALRQE